MAAAVLIVEDDVRFRDSFAGAIRAAPDFTLAGTARDLAAARALLARCTPDVLMLDLGLPDGSGLQLIHEVAERMPTCDIVVVTVFGDHRSVLASIRAGATGYLLKDASDVDIVGQIRLLQGGGSPISPSIARFVLQCLGGRSVATGASAPVLSGQEAAVLRYCAKGYEYDEVARLMNLSRHTVGTYVKRIYRKLQVHSKTEAIYEARKLGLVAD